MLIITFHNDGTGDVIEGNYDYSVYINKDLIYTGRLEGHNRLDGWQDLIHILSNKIKEDAIKFWENLDLG